MRNIPFDTQGKLDLIYEIMERELSFLQKQTLEDYYLNGMTIKQIARKRGVNKSTIQRTLKRGERKIRRFLLL